MSYKVSGVKGTSDTQLNFATIAGSEGKPKKRRLLCRRGETRTREHRGTGSPDVTGTVINNEFVVRRM